MKRLLLSTAFWFICVFIAFGQQSAQVMPLVGTWQGALQMGGTKLRLVFHIKADANGTLSATMDSPDQNAKGIPVQSTRLVQDSLFLDIPAIGGSYKGKLMGPDKIDGVLKQGSQTMPIPLTKGEIEAAKRPQTPVKPYPYKEQEVSIENKEAGITLAGTLTIPSTKGPHPAVVLISGSGPQDRDQTILEHKSFLVLADHLTRQGFAVLRLDDRGVGKSGGNFATATTQDFASDTKAAYNFLKNQKDISGKKIGLIGHSEGALVAAKVAAQQPDVAFVVLLAGSAVPGTELLVAQNKALLQAAGIPQEILQPYLALRKAQFEAAATEPDAFKAADKIRELQQEAKSNFTVQQQTQLGLTPQGEQAIVAQLSTPWYKYFLAYNPAPGLQKLKMPVLALFGSKDLQVPAAQNKPATEKALKAGANKKYKVQELEGLNHLFQTANTGTVAEYGQLEETLAPVVLETIATWMKQTIK